MGSSFSEKLKQKKVAYGSLLMSLGILLHLALQEFNIFDEELIGFLTGLFFGAGFAITLSVFIKKKNT